jgi:hypothetical protein
MSSIFNPGFLLLSCILILAVGGLVIYFERKLREQNNRISSIGSLLKTLAEDMIYLKNSRVGGANEYVYVNNLNQPMDIRENDEDLIDVSDDEESDKEEDDEPGDDEEDEEDEEFVCELEELSQDEEDDSEDEEEDSEDEEDVFGVEGANLEEVDCECDCECIEAELEEVTLPQEPEQEEPQPEQIEELEPKNLESELKKINIDLEEGEKNSSNTNTTTTSADFKKMTIVELRNYVVEKQLADSTSANKLKKNKLLQLVGAE